MRRLSPNPLAALLMLLTPGCDDAPPVEEEPVEVGVAITWPDEGEQASERIVVVAEATPLEAILGVEFAIIESGLELRYDTDLTPPFESVLDTTAWPDGPLDIRATAVGRDGQSATDLVTVVVDNAPPELELLSPSPEVVQFLESGTVELVARARDGSGIESVSLTVAGAPVEPVTGRADDEFVAVLDLSAFSDLEERELRDLDVEVSARDSFGRSTQLTSSLRIARRRVWHAVLPSPVAGAAAYSPDHQFVYLATEQGEVFALAASDGREVCRSGAAGEGFRGPAVAPDGSAVFIGTGSGLWAVRPAPDCTPRWNVRSGEVAQGVPAIDPFTGNIFFTTREGGLHAVTPSGSVLWSRSDVGLSRSGPTLVPYLRFVVVCSDQLYAVSLGADDAIQPGFAWTAETGGELEASAALFEDRLYVGAEDFNVYSFHVSDGSRVWDAPFPTDRRISTTPFVDSDGFVYVTSRDSTLYKLSAERALVWRYEVASGIDYSSPFVDEGAGLVLFGETGSTDASGPHGVLHAVDQETGLAVWTAVLEGFVSAPPAVADGVVVIGTSLGQVDAFFLDSDSALRTLDPTD